MVLPYIGGIPAIDEYYKSQNIDPLDLLHTDSREYVVTLHNYEDLDDFYKDMELNSNLEPIPDRECECTEKRPKSKSTHYNLTGKEAVTLRNDKRVKIVEETPKRLEDEYGIKCISDWEQTGDWDKSPDTDGAPSGSSIDLQWGIARSVFGYNVNNWGTDGPYDAVTATIRTTSSGKNVDVVIWDSAHVGPIDHPEFAVNSDGTGGSRIKQINWFQYSGALGYTTEATYEYTVLGNHGTSVASIVAGNRYGWARDANIYSISYDPISVSGQPSSWQLWALDYIKYWHQHKEINPETGRRNPTIINASWNTQVEWGYIFRTEPRLQPPYGDSNLIGARTKDVETHGQGVGVIDLWAPSFTGEPLSPQELKATLSTHWPTVYSNINSNNPNPFGDAPPNWTDGVAVQPAYVETLADQVEDIVTEGCGSFSSLLFVGSAGNDYFGIDKVPDDGIQTFNIYSADQGSHFNHDYLLFQYYDQGQRIVDWWPTARGATPSNSPSSINVGNLDTLVSQYKRNSSNFATGVDVWAPGDSIITAAINTNNGDYPTDSNYGIGVFGGTSAAAPQVAGVLACEMELNPMMNVSQAKRYLKMNCTASLENGSGTSNGNFQDSGSDITEPSEKYGGKSRVGAKRVIKTEVKRNYGQAPAGAVSTPFTSPIYPFGYSYPHQNFGIRQYENENPDSLVSPTWRAPQIFDNKTRGIAYPRSSRSFNRGNFNCQEMDYSNNNRIIYDIFYSGTYEGKVAWGLYLGGVTKVDSGIIDPPSAIPQSVLDSINLVDPITGIPYAYRYEILDYLNLLSATYHSNSGSTISPEDGGNIANSDNYSIIELVEVQDLGNAIRYNCKVQKCPVQCSDYRSGIDTMKYGLGASLSWSTGVSYIRALESNTTYFNWKWILKWDNEIIYASPISATDNWPSGKGVTGGLIYDNTSVDGYKYYNDTNSRLNNAYAQSDTVSIQWNIYDVKRCR